MTEEKPLPEKKLTLKSIASLLTEPEPQLEWLIENMWVNKSRGLIAGNPGVGKTWIALDMLISVASGGLCMGKFPVKKGAVMLVEEEASEMNLARRCHAMARARGLADVDLTNFFHLTRQFVKIPADMRELFWMIAENDIKLVVFDSLRRFHSGDENSSTEMQAVLDAFAKINALSGCSVVLIHHLAKANEMSHKPLFERLRGSSDLWAWRDCLIGVEGEEDSLDATCSFQFRDAEAQAPLRVKRVVNDKSGAIHLEASGIEETEDFVSKSDAILDYMRSQFGAVSKDQILKNVKGRRQELGRIFKAMGAKKMILKDGLRWVIGAVPELAGTVGNAGNG